MINKIKSDRRDNQLGTARTAFSIGDAIEITQESERLPEILFVTSYPPRECGIATYSQDLIAALTNKFQDSFSLRVAALETCGAKHSYSEDVAYVLETDRKESYQKLARDLNADPLLKLIVVQHEFGLFKTNEADFIAFLKALDKPIIVAFHTILPNPDALLRKNVLQIDAIAGSFIVMTEASAKLLRQEYGIASDKIAVIPHGTHLVRHTDSEILKKKYKLSGRKIISTFGLLSSGKSIETTLDAMPAIAAADPDVLFLIIGKTHPSVKRDEGERYRNGLAAKVRALGMQEHVKFINSYLPLDRLLDYLQLTDIYLFTSNDPNQAVSGTFSYAISCGCPVVSTPIPHAMELLQDGSGIIIGFGDAAQLEKEVVMLLESPQRRREISANGIHKLAPAAWENAAIAHAKLFDAVLGNTLQLHYKKPAISLSHFKSLTTPFGMIQFSIINQPDLKSGYTLDDNSRALVAMCQHFELTRDEDDLDYLILYYRFIRFCLQEGGGLLNYADAGGIFTDQNSENLQDANGRAVWALGFLISMEGIMPRALVSEARNTLQKALKGAEAITSTRAMAFIIKGVYYSNKNKAAYENVVLVRLLADRMVQMYLHESKPGWHWFESYLTYGNSILPEAMLCAYLATGDLLYKETARTSFDFLLSKIMTESRIKVISNKGWLYNDRKAAIEAVGGEQPIDVAYTILALSRFYETFKDRTYLREMEIAFSWFLGNNHLEQIIYNPCTGGCYDGLEENYVNLNQGAESTVSYLMARLTVEKYAKKENNAPTGRKARLHKAGKS